MTTLRQSSNTQLAYRDTGGGRPILLVHGWGVSGALFEAQWRELASSFRVVVPDLPGHGASGAFPARASFAELRLGRVLLVGWSLGAMVAWDLVRRRRLAVAGLVTIDMLPQLLSEPGWPHELRGATDRAALVRDVPAMRADWPAYAASFVPRIVAPATAAAHPDLLARIVAVAQASDADSMANIWLRMADQDFRAVPGAVDVPARVVAGAHSDLYSVAASRWVAEQLPHGRLEVFERSGHAPQLEEADRFNSMLSAFADELDFTNSGSGGPEAAVSQSH